MQRVSTISRRHFSDTTRRRRLDMSQLWTNGSFPVVEGENKTEIYDTWGMLSSLPISHGYGYTSALQVINTLPTPKTSTTAATTSASSTENSAKIIS
ncbi:hypothetical protein Ae201684P_009124 [Aphanomyces euteiches]|uniref:Uncharacterized protein n=1 Tax=Aphanomyces euteiches TaxID=100861 RepID=A0A6G0WEH0_9STRA|nr:hypothetical protein Ae201684_015864 [Aphanomyces euteiches]KAH9080178.1 hypothetical protein Ae201684P_009124 [Aphanomyces euteiches]